MKQYFSSLYVSASAVTLNIWSQFETLLAYCYLEQYLFSFGVSGDIETDVQFLKGHYAFMGKKRNCQYYELKNKIIFQKQSHSDEILWWHELK